MARILEMPPPVEPAENKPEHKPEVVGPREAKYEVLAEFKDELRELIRKDKNPGSAAILIPLLDKYGKRYNRANGDFGFFNDIPFVSDLVNHPERRAHIFEALRKEIDIKDAQKPPEEFQKAA